MIRYEKKEGEYEETTHSKLKQMSEWAKDFQILTVTVSHMLKKLSWEQKYKKDPYPIFEDEN